ncbi:hypothetical protein BDN71DRAFT_1430270 [Pleurotus eryngii]|uniref:Uncharacterized protein n=1 Tax=Pleurotus eryngii TaxID=5323 RepID=A0A9P6A3F9_PLEER|nr:hypothetical protein BDN71DRAFT_1430270 [Pleurotus eryngii]
MASGGCWGATTMGGARRGHHGWGVHVGGEGVGGVGVRASTFGHWTMLGDVVGHATMLGDVGGRCRRRGMRMDVDGIEGDVGGARRRWRRWTGGTRQCWWAGACGRWRGVRVDDDDDDVGGVGGMLGGMGGAEVMVVEGGAVVREEKEVGGQGTNLRRASSSFPAVPLRPRDVGLCGGILVLWGRWGQSEGMGEGRGNAREARKRGCADERSVRDSASALMLRPPSPAVSRFRREHGERRAPRRSPQRRQEFNNEASILEGGARGIPKVRVSERGVRGDP